MKYYLLTFNEDYADEHDVPALQCFTKEQYDQWLEKQFAELNHNYDSEILEYNKLSREDGYRRKPNKYINSKIITFLGNSGEGFEENFLELFTGKDFVDNDYVKVLEVPKEFYDTFHKAKLNQLSLTNIFDLIE